MGHLIIHLVGPLRILLRKNKIDEGVRKGLHPILPERRLQVAIIIISSQNGNPLHLNRGKLPKFNSQSSLEDPNRGKKGPRGVPKELQIGTREPSRAPEGSKGRQSAPPGTPREPFRSLREHPGTLKNLGFLSGKA